MAVIRFPEKRKVPFKILMELIVEDPVLAAKFMQQLCRVGDEKAYSREAGMYFMLGYFQAICQVSDPIARKHKLEAIMDHPEDRSENVFDWLGPDRKYGWPRRSR